MPWFLKSKTKTPIVRDFYVPAGVRIYAIGDIHGRADLLEKLMFKINEDAQSFDGEHIIEVYLGDYVDRGPDSPVVLETLLASPPKGHQRYCLCGNHEQTLLNFLDDANILANWIHYGGLPTLAAYGVPIDRGTHGQAALDMQAVFREELPKTHLAFLRSLQYSFESGDYYFVHAGINKDRPLTAQSPRDQLWIREPFLSHQSYFERYIVHGHTPVESAELLFNRANLDISNAPTPSLCALRIEGNRRETLVVRS